MDRVTKQINAQGNATQFVYDTDSNLLAVTDANGHTTSFTYDSMNRLLTKTDPLGKTDTRTYDSDDNLTQFVDRRGQTSKFLYDNLNRLIEADYQDSTVARSYDALGRLVHVNDSASGEFDFSYDTSGRLLSTTNPVGSVQYTYDGDGRTTSRQVVGQSALQYSYDRVGNLLSAALPQASAAFTYDNRDQLTTLIRTNGVISRYQYDPAGRLLSLTHTGPAGVLNTQSYSYNAAGDPTAYTTNIAEPLVTQPMSNQYDAANRLIQSNSQAGLGTYSYDPDGNLVLASVPSGISTNSWDSRGRLHSIAGADGQNTVFTYDFARSLIAQQNSGPLSNITTQFVLDNLTNVSFLKRSDGSSLSILAGQSIDTHIAVVDSNGNSAYALEDRLNSTVGSVDQAGKLATSFFYEPFGQTTSIGTYPFEYTGRVPVTGSLYYYRARYYDSTTGRFTSEDPIGFTGGANFYTYVDNEPIGSTDPTGLCYNCAVPRHPADADIELNMLQAQRNGGLWWAWTILRDWNYKLYHGQTHHEYDDFGNFNYGATGCALGIPLNTLLKGAGGFKLTKMVGRHPIDMRLGFKHPLGIPWGKFPYGNEYDKQLRIIEGYDYCKKCSTVNLFPYGDLQF